MANGVCPPVVWRSMPMHGASGPRRSSSEKPPKPGSRSLERSGAKTEEQRVFRTTPGTPQALNLTCSECLRPPPGVSRVFCLTSTAHQNKIQ